MWLTTSTRYARPRLQELEDRSLFSVNFPGLANFLVTGDNVSGRLDTLHNNLVTQVNSVKVDLPVLNDSLDGIREAKSFLDAVRGKLHDALTSLGNTTDPSQVKQAIFDALGPQGSGIDVLGNLDQDPQITKDDVGVAFANGNNDVTITLHLHKAIPVTGSAFNFGVGLPGLGLDAQGDVHVDLTFDYEPLTIKVTNSNTFALDTTPAEEIKLGVNATIPGGQIHGQLGFLAFSATDAGTHFDGTFKMDVTTSGSALQVSAPHLSGTAEVMLDLDATFGVNTDPQYAINAPGIGAQLHVLWNFANEDHVGSTSHDFGDNPLIELNDIELKLGTFVTDLVKPAIDLVQFVTAPFAPIFKLLDEPLPILSDAVELLGDDDGMSLLDVADLILDTGAVPTEWKLLAQIAIALIDLTNLINGIQPSDPSDTSLQNAAIQLGNYTISGDGGTDIRDLLAPAKGLTDPDWSQLVGALAGAVNPIKDQITNLSLPDGMGDKINEVLDKYQQVAQNGIDLAFPFFDNFGNGVVQLLLGHDVDLVSFTMHFFADGSVPLPSFSLGGINIDLNGAFKIDTDFKIAYDTFGLREVLKGNKDLTGLKDGFYLGSDSKIFLDGELSAEAAVGTDFYEAGIFGGLKGNILTTLDQSNNNPGVDGDTSKLRFFAGELGDCFIDVEGEIGGYLDLGVKIGVKLPVVGFVGVELSFNLAEKTLPFSTGCTNPFAEPPQMQLADFLDPNNPGVLTLNMGSQQRRDARQYKSDVEDETFALTLDPDDPLKIAVYFGGQKQSFADVTKIVAFGDSMNDKITIADDVLLDVELHGGTDNDQLICHGGATVQLFGDEGDDILEVGLGNGTLLGGDGNDQMKGGSGSNLLGELNGEPGDDVLTGGTGPNILYGGVGNDILYAGPLDDLLDGGVDDDLLVAGIGNATMNGNRGNDQFHWKAGDGNPNIDGGGGTDSLGMTGSDAADSFVLRPINNARLQVEVSDDLKKLLATPRSANVEYVEVEGLGGADNVVVKALLGTAVEVVSVDTSDKLTPDGAKDTIVVNATVQAETLTVETVDAQIKLPPPHELGEHGGIMKISGLPRVANQLQPTYVVFAMNYADDLTLNAFPGDDAINIKSITGPTTIRGNMANGPALGSDNDVITVFAQKPTVGAVPGDYLDLLTVNGDRGMNTLIVDETQSTIADQIKFTSTQITGKLLPGVTYMASGGAWKPGVFLKTGPFADIVNVVSTLDGPVTSVSTFGGDDIVNVSSNAPGKYGNLLGIAGTLSIDTGPGVQNKLNLIDSTATAGNQNVVVTSDKIMGFAGPIDDTIVKFASTFGQLQVLLEGSNTLAEKFLVDSPAAKLVIHGNGGSEQFKVLGTVQPATFDGGLGDDLFTFGFGTNKLDTLLGNAVVLAGPGKDLVLVQDQLAAAGKTYQLGALGLSRTGTGVISFDTSLETLNLGTSNLTNTTQVIGTPTATMVNLNSAGGMDTLIGPNANNTWQILATDAGTLNDRIKFVATEKLLGGVLGDRFILANGKGLTGNIHGQQGQDILDYGAYTTAVKFNFATNVAPNIAGFGGIKILIGGKTLLDILIGPNQPTDWHITSDDRGLAGPVAFVGVENLVGGTGPDVFNFHEVPGPAPVLAKLTGFLQGQAGIDRLDYTVVTAPVNVDLAAGQATGVGGVVSGIENITGGQGDDVLAGDGLPNVMFGGAGADILLGRGGADELHGDAGRDFLIGRLGADTQFGGADDDLLIAGTTTYDGQPASLRAILAEWNQPAESYDRRVATLRSGVGPNNSVVLTSATVSDDLAADELWGGLGDDWFWATLPTDTIPDLLLPPERVN